MTDKIKERSVSLSGEVGFPTSLYFQLLDMLEGKGYTVKKKSDWLEVNPHSDYYQDVVQKKQNIEQQVGRIMPNISDMRKDLEMLRHDKRKLDRIIEHKENGDIDYLKSDFVDLVDRNTETSLLSMANNGIFPSIVVDFYKIESRDDIDELEVSKGEKEVLRKKWQLFQDWMNRFVSEIRKRDKMVEEEIESKKATIEYYKDMLKPYLKALQRIKITEPEEYKGLDDPRIVERYSTSIAGVELYAWKKISSKGHGDKGYYSFFEIDIRKRAVVESGHEKENMEIDISSYLKDGDGIGEKKRELEKQEEEIFRTVGRMKGEKFEEEIEESEEETESSTGDKILSSIVSRIKKMMGFRSEHGLIGDDRKELRNDVAREFESVYSGVKEKANALKM